MIYWLQFLGLVLFTVLIHEAGHAIVATLCGLKVEVFSIGFWKPAIFKKKIKGTEFRVTPWLLGGYVAFEGEKNGDNKLFSLPYGKKAMILLAGVVVNLVVGLICYLINYQSIKVGLCIDYIAVESLFTKEYSDSIYLFSIFKPNVIIWQLGLMNILCFITNLLPIPALDGSYLWMVWLEKIYPKTYKDIIAILCTIGFYVLGISQILLIVYLYFWR